MPELYTSRKHNAKNGKIRAVLQPERSERKLSGLAIARWMWGEIGKTGK
jgi:hypothetical protein